MRWAGMDAAGGAAADLASLREQSLDRIADAASGLLAALDALPGAVPAGKAGFTAAGPGHAGAPPAPRTG
jgi:hypothetical protein